MARPAGFVSSDEAWALGDAARPVNASTELTQFMFLYSIEELSRQQQGQYSRGPMRAVLSALVAVAPGARSLLTVGDALLSWLSSKLTEIASVGPERGREGVASTYSLDKGLHITLTWDLCDAFAEQSHDVDLDRVATALLRHDLFFLGVTGLTQEQAAAISERLVDSAYLGFVQVDPGNPVQRDVLAGFNKGYLIDGTLVIDPFETDSPFDPQPLDAEHPDAWWLDAGVSARYLREDEDRDALPGAEHVAISERGALSASVLARRLSTGHLDRVAASLAEGRHFSAPIRIRTTTMPRAADAVVALAKLTDYALNPEHPKGRHKAKLFAELLGIEAEHADYLAGQLKHGLAGAEVVREVRGAEHGVQYHVVVDIRGVNGEVRPVVAAWIIREDGLPSLTTAYVADPGTPADAPGYDVVVDPTLTDGPRHEALWRLAESAAAQAARVVVPTPMRVDGTWIPEGAFGGAVVIVEDEPFASWLISAGHARTVGSKVWVPAPGLSADRTRAYAAVMAEIFELNGVVAIVETYLD
jgi:hypothetical protein